MNWLQHLCQHPLTRGTWAVSSGPADATPSSGPARWVQIPPTPQALAAVQIYGFTLTLDCVPMSIHQIRVVFDSLSRQKC